MGSIEVTGKTLEEAKKAAAKKLGVEVSQIEVTVLEESKGLFGKSSVRISASAPQSAASAPEKAIEKEAAAAEPAKEIQESFDEAPPAEVQKDNKRGKPRRAAREKDEAAAPAEASKPKQEGDTGEREGPNATDQDADQLCNLVKELVASADLDVTISGSSYSGRYVNIELEGRDVAHLVGKHGEVLNALQYLVNIIAGKKFNNGIRATLDGNSYRQRREEALYQLATRVAQEVKNRGEEAVLDALPAFERRIIHKSLSEFDGVQTYSEGEEPNRRVVIAPVE